MITLRAIEKEDLNMLKRWRNSQGVLPWCRQYRGLSYDDMVTWYDGLTKDKQYNLINDLFIIEWDGTPIGVGCYVRIDWRNRKAEVSFYVGEDTRRTSQVINQALLAVVEYGLSTLNLWKIYFPVYQGNPNLSMYEKVLEREYVAKQECYWNGKYLDRLILVRYNDKLQCNSKV